MPPLPDDAVFYVPFEMTDPDTGIVFRDALSHTRAEWESMSEKDVRDEEQARFDAWKNAPVVDHPDPTPDQIRQNLIDATNQLSDLISQLPTA